MSESGSILDVPMVCSTCGSTFRLGECEAVDAYEHKGPYEGEIGCPVPDCGGIMQEFGPMKTTVSKSGGGEPGE